MVVDSGAQEEEKQENSSKKRNRNRNKSARNKSLAFKKDARKKAANLIEDLPRKVL